MSDAVSSESEDTLSISFLDVISCGLGAAVLLFLVLSVVRIEVPAQGTPSPGFIVAVFRLAPTLGEKPINPYIRPNVRITHENGDWTELPLENRPDPAGKIRASEFPSNDPRSARFAALNARAKGGIYLTGFTFRSKDQLSAVSEGPGNRPLVFTLTLLKPEQGKWQIDLVANDLEGTWSVMRQVFTAAGELGGSDVKQPLSNKGPDPKIMTRFAAISVESS